MADDVTKVADELEIRALVSRYADAVSRSDETAWRATWASDGVWELMGMKLEGAEGIVDFWRRAMGTFEFVCQLVQGGFVDLEGDEARGRFAMTELGKTKGGDGTLLVALYEDRYRRTQDGWRFAHRQLHPLYQGPPDLSGASFQVSDTRS